MKPAPASSHSARNASGMPFGEFVAFVAAAMALNALAIDVMLPALPMLAESLQLQNSNDRQLVIVVYLGGFAVSQLVFGPLSDRFGRRPVLLGGLGLFSLACLLSTLAQSFDQMLAARLLQGFAAAAPRVIGVALVRDSYSGREMGRVMSFAMMIFMAVPVLAPSIGALILLVAPWRAVFGLLMLAALAMAIWAGLRLRETLKPEQRRPLSVSVIAAGYAETARTRITAGYGLAMGLVFGALISFVTSAQQIFMDVFGMGSEFTVLFAAVTLGMVGSAFANAKMVRRLGLRRLSHTALCCFILVCGLHWCLAASGEEQVTLFVLMQALTIFLFGFLGPNFNAIAMQPMGHIAGTAAAMLGFVSTGMAAAIGAVVGGAFDGSTVPLTAGSTLLGALALLVLMVTERGKLFSALD